MSMANRRSVSPENVNEVVSELSGIQKREGNSLGYGKTVSKNLGASYALVSMAKSYGIRDMLTRHFGSFGDRILSVAITDTILGSKTLPAGCDPTTEMAPELLGMHTGDSGPNRDEVISYIGGNPEAIDEMMGEMLATSERVTVYEDSFFEVGDGRFRTTLLTGKDGVPVYYNLQCSTDGGRFPGISLEGRVRDALFVLREPLSDLNLLKSLCCQNFSFIAVIDPYSEWVRDVTSFESRMSVQSHGGNDYAVRSYSIRDWSYGHVVPMLYTYLPENSCPVDRARTERKIYTISHRLKSLDPEEAIRQFHDTAGSLSRFFDISIKDGNLELDIRRGDLDEYIDPKPHVLLTSGFDSWESVMNILDSAEDFDEVAFRFGESLASYERDGSEVACRGMAFIAFLSLVMRSLMDRSLRQVGSDTDVDTVLMWLDSLKSIGDGKEWRAVGMTPRIRNTLMMLGVTPPKGGIVLRSRSLAKAQAIVALHYVFDCELEVY